MGEVSAAPLTEDDVPKEGVRGAIETGEGEEERAGEGEEERAGEGEGEGVGVSISGGAVDDHRSMRDVFQGSFVLMLPAWRDEDWAAD